MNERFVPKLPVRGEPAYPEGVFTGNDHNVASRLVVRPTGLFGKGKPVFIGLVSDFESEAQIPEGTIVVTITNPTKMFYPYCETSAEKVVAGRRVQEVLVTPVEKNSSE